MEIKISTKTKSNVRVKISQVILFMVIIFTASAFIGTFASYASMGLYKLSGKGYMTPEGEIGCGFNVGGPCYSAMYRSEAESKKLSFYPGSCLDMDFCQSGSDLFKFAQADSYCSDCSPFCVGNAVQARVCETDEYNDSAVCVNSGKPSSCVDSNPCTIDGCSDGKCTHKLYVCDNICTTTQKKFSDGTIKTVPAIQVMECDGVGGCKPSSDPSSCDDGNECTNDACIKVSGKPTCDHSKVGDGTNCGDLCQWCINGSCAEKSCSQINNQIDCDGCQIINGKEVMDCCGRGQTCGFSRGEMEDNPDSILCCEAGEQGKSDEYVDTGVALGIGNNEKKTNYFCCENDSGPVCLDGCCESGSQCCSEKIKVDGVEYDSPSGNCCGAGTSCCGNYCCDSASQICCFTIMPQCFSWSYLSDFMQNNCVNNSASKATFEWLISLPLSVSSFGITPTINYINQLICIGRADSLPSEPSEITSCVASGGSYESCSANWCNSHPTECASVQENFNSTYSNSVLGTCPVE